MRPGEVRNMLRTSWPFEGVELELELRSVGPSAQPLPLHEQSSGTPHLLECALLAKVKGKVSRAQEKSHRTGGSNPQVCRAGDRIWGLGDRWSVARGIFRAMTFRRRTGKRSRDGALGQPCLLILRFPTRTALWTNHQKVIGKGHAAIQAGYPSWSPQHSSGESAQCKRSCKAPQVLALCWEGGQGGSRGLQVGS